MLSLIREVEEVWNEPLKNKGNVCFVVFFTTFYLFAVWKYGFLFGIGFGWLPATIVALAAKKLLPFVLIAKNPIQKIVNISFVKLLCIFFATFVAATIVAALFSSSAKEAMAKGLIVALIPPVSLALKTVSNKFDTTLFGKTRKYDQQDENKL